jgi:hypothetical protein
LTVFELELEPMQEIRQSEVYLVLVDFLCADEEGYKSTLKQWALK